MSKTLGTMVTEVRNRLDEATQTFWTDVQLRTWINSAVRDISRRAEPLLSTATIAATAGTQAYAAPTDVVRISRAEWQPSGQTTIYPLDYKDYNGMDAIWQTSQAITQGYPSFFTLWGYPPTLTLTLYPIPSTNGNVKVFYYRLSADLATDGTADASNVDVPEGWWDLIIDHAEYVALRKDGDPRWQEAKGLYEEALQSAIDNSRRWADATGSLEYQNSVLPAWLWAGGDY